MKETDILVYADCYNTFDRVNHKLFCVKIKYFDLGSTAIAFFDNYLIKRSLLLLVSINTYSCVVCFIAATLCLFTCPILFLVEV